MGEQVNYKRNLLFRKNRAKLHLSNYQNKILDLFKISPDDINFLTLEESDKIRKYNFTGRIETIRYKNDEFDIKASMLNICRNYTSPWFVFIDDDWKYCGCFEIDDLSCLNDDFKFGGMISDDIVFINKNCSIKIVYDCFEMDNNHFIDCEMFKN